ncbi:MAG: beta-ketoacyl-ACP synthase I [Acidiferrobacterales bacterium]|nr:beta-ketoacyl-ACP synthase I [Acidiferrobacterales bacterium]
MRRVVVTGLGIVSSIGRDCREVTQSLRDGVSGVSFEPQYEKLGFRSQIHGAIDLDLDRAIDRRARRFMGDGAAYNYLAMHQAIEDSGLDEEQVSNPRTGMIMGSGGASTENIIAATDMLRSKGIRGVGPFRVPRTMSSTNSATLSTNFKIRGVSYSVSSACATSAHCIGNAMELIQLNKQDIVFAGGGDEIHWSMTMLFDAMRALSGNYNDCAERASRPFDVSRDGFVISGGGGVVVLEELESALARGARIYAELIGYGATSDGFDMVQPSGDGAVRCMRMALENVDQPVDYINAHGTSTPIGDTQELNAICEVFSDIPRIASTKSLTGHALGAAGVNEAIYTLLMMDNDFISPSINIEELDPAAADMPIVREPENIEVNTAMSNSFGFGGTNATLVFQKLSP